jgi:hypothetical protein
MFTSDNMDRTAEASDSTLNGILVLGFGAAAVALVDALDDVIDTPDPWCPVAFLLCDPDSDHSIASATRTARDLRDKATRTIGVALGPCGDEFTAAVDVLVRLPVAEAESVVRPLLGATFGHDEIIPFDAEEMRFLFEHGGEAVAVRRGGVTTATLWPAIVTEHSNAATKEHFKSGHAVGGAGRRASGGPCF